MSSVSPLLHPCVSYAQVSVLCFTSVSHLRLCREFHGCVLSRPLPLGRHVLNSHVLLKPYCTGNIRVTHTALSSTGRRCSVQQFSSVQWTSASAFGCACVRCAECTLLYAYEALRWVCCKALNRIFFWSFDNIGNEEKNVVKID